MSRVTDAYIEVTPIYCFFKTNCNTRFGTCVDIVPYLCKFETKWHQVLDPSLSNLHKVACRILFESRVNRHICDVVNFINKRHFE